MTETQKWPLQLTHKHAFCRAPFVTQVLALRAEAAKRVENTTQAVVQQDRDAEMASMLATQQMEAAAAAAEEAARKEKRAWPPKVCLCLRTRVLSASMIHMSTARKAQETYNL